MKNARGNPTPLAYAVFTVAWGAAALAVVFMLFLGVIGVMAIGNSFGRSQDRADAHNKVSITRIEIQNQEQQAKVVTAQDAIVSAQAEQRFIAATGIRRAQDEIARTLTPLYIQHEAIEAEQAIATSGQNNTVVYVPSGSMGVPLVQNATNPSGHSH